MTQTLDNLKTNIGQLSQEELVDLEFSIKAELKRRENDVKAQMKDRIAELLSEKNLLSKSIYTMADVCAITKAPRSLVSKIKDELDKEVEKPVEEPVEANKESE